jgi:hypothetical protein
MIRLIIILLFLCGCQPTSLEDFQDEGASCLRVLLEDLRKVETREDLALIEPIVRKRFDVLVEIMIQARIFEQKNPGSAKTFSSRNQVLSDALLEEMKRLYCIEGGKEFLERTQKEAMLRLDAKEKLIERQKLP